MLTVYLLVCAMMALTRAAGNSSRAEEAKSCPDSWTSYNESCFFFIVSLMTWADAEKHCQTLDGNLASVHSFDEQHVIQKMIHSQTLAYPETWLGGYDATQEGTWFWSDGTDFNYTFWASGEPSNRRNEDCLLMNYGDEEKFGDQPCEDLRPFACGKKV